MPKRHLPEDFTHPLPTFTDDSTESVGRDESSSPRKCLDTDAQQTSSTVEYHCNLPPHRGHLTFHSHDDYEVHYIQEHTNRCMECGKNFPTLHILGLHIEETHDPVMQTKRDRGEKTYGCFVEDCDKRCRDPSKRRLHCIDKHMFPRNYNFWVINHGIDHSNSMLRSELSQKRRLSKNQKNREGCLRHERFSSSPEPAGRQGGAEVAGQMQTDSESPSSMDINALTMSMSALRFVPTSLTARRPG